MKNLLEINIPLEELQFSFVRSGGPGGQNVNKVNSKAVLRWSVLASPSLTEDVRGRFLTRFAGRITTEGDLIITSQKYRDQGRNADDCVAKLEAMVQSVALPPTLRRKTKPSRSSVRKRLESKKKLGEKKMRRRTSADD